MLRSNSKKARENVHKYINEHNDDIMEYAKYHGYESATDEELRGYVIQEFEDVFKHEIARRNRQDAFEQYAQGLPFGNLFTYYYNVSAVDVLGDILEETQEERERFTEEQAARMLTYLIFSECDKTHNKR